MEWECTDRAEAALPSGAEPQPRLPLPAVTSRHFLLLYNASQKGTISYNFVNS